MTLYVVRHASAGARGQYDGDDLERPLDTSGRAQSTTIAAALSDRPIGRLLSSGAVRCVQTLDPLAESLGLPVEVHDALIEGGPTVYAVELLRDMAVEDGDVVLCSHGDVIPPMLETLLGEGMVVVGRQGCEKGSIWQLEERGRDIVSARYTSAVGLSRDLAST